MKKIQIVIALLVLIMALALASQPKNNKLDYLVQSSYAGTSPAPDFPADVDWLNTDHALSLKELEGKIVLLDFWTYGCVNCMHIIPDLKRLEAKYANELVVIGVHSAKFDNEGNSENIRNIILRYGIKHPVINDKDFRVWRSYGARAWPTLVLIDPVGKVIGKHAGEGIYEIFDRVIAGAIEEFDAQGLIKTAAIEFKVEEARAQTPLLFPGKVLADSKSQRLFIADSNHNRIVITDFEGNVEVVIGSGQEALRDGDYSQAAFNRPQGLTLANDNILYVADTDNHAIRKIDLISQSVETIAGNGSQQYIRVQKAAAKDFALNTPWDVLFYDNLLYIAMAGQHQLWVYEPDSQVISAFAGTRREELKDAPLLQAGLNQPSGLTTDGEHIYFADSEASAIRYADIEPSGNVKTIVGTGLFDFGDIDGTANTVRLQHPLGVAYNQADGLLYFTDTYNSKIKVLNPESREVKSLFGSQAGWQDGKLGATKLYEPAGLSIANNKLYIADTNNHVIRVADLKTNELKTLVLLDNNNLLTANSQDDNNILRLKTQTIAVGEQAIELKINLPVGYKFNNIAPFSMHWQASNDLAEFFEDAEQTIVEPKFPLKFTVDLKEGKTILKGDLTIYYCEYESLGLCLIEPLQVELPLNVISESENSLKIEYSIPKPEDFNNF